MWQDLFLRPRSIALLGASRNPMKGGHAILKNLLTKINEIKIYPINPKADEILGIKCYKSLLDVPFDVDLVIFFIPPDQVIESMNAVIKKNVKAVLIESAGFAEVGSIGDEIQQEVKVLAIKHGIKVWGANCMGYLDSETNFTTTFMYIQEYKKGNIGLISQSGMILGGFFERLRTKGEVGFSKIFTVGNQIDVNALDCLKILKDDPNTNVIGIYLETIKNPREFMSLTRSIIREEKKPIFCIKGGRSPLGKRAARSHTGSIAEDIKLFDSLAHQAGIIQVDDFSELMKNLKLFSYFLQNNIALPRTKEISIITFSGGTGVVFTDIVDKYGLAMAKFSDDALEKMASVYPPWMKPESELPLDTWPAFERNGKKAFYTCLEAALETPNLSGLVFTIPGLFKDFENEVENISKIYNKYKKPIVALQMFGDYNRFQHINKLFQDKYIPVYDSISDGIRCLSNFINYGIKNL
ncbi:MAG: CoA-binding protein [Candidatus Helarchaeota archaeon]